ncbi:MAG: hypothetical protein OEY49_18990, partial [Candidatus Heimdallarchaeota archaeon]|nr:hypothetical protein [Candidatus Heimdallarchaeota archaeon]
GKQKLSKKTRKTIGIKEKLVNETSKFTELFLKDKNIKVDRINQSTLRLNHNDETYELSSNIENTTNKVKYFGLGMKIFEFIMSDIILDNFIEFVEIQTKKEDISKLKNQFDKSVKISEYKVNLFLVEYLVRLKTLASSSDEYISFYKYKEDTMTLFQRSKNSIIKNLKIVSNEEQYEIDPMIIESLDSLDKIARKKLSNMFKKLSLEKNVKAEMEDELDQLINWYEDIINLLKNNNRIEKSKRDKQIDELEEDYLHYKNEINRRYISNYDVIPNLIAFGSIDLLQIESKLNKIEVLIIPNNLMKYSCIKCGNKNNLVFDDTSYNLICTKCSKVCEINNEIYQIRSKDVCDICKNNYCHIHELNNCLDSPDNLFFCKNEFVKCNNCNFDIVKGKGVNCEICKNNYCQTKSLYFKVKSHEKIKEIVLSFDDKKNKMIKLSLNSYEISPMLIIKYDADRNVVLSPNPRNMDFEQPKEIRYQIKLPKEETRIPINISYKTNKSKNTVNFNMCDNLRNVIDRKNNKVFKQLKVCIEDSYYCINHKELHSIKTAKSTCEECNNLICLNTKTECIICKNHHYCNTHAKMKLNKCSICKKEYCDQHQLDICNSSHKMEYYICNNHKLNCFICGTVYCKNHINSCSFDDDELICIDHTYQLSKDSYNKQYCKNHIYRCENHSNLHLISEKSFSCHIDSVKSCNKSSIICLNCNNKICKNHIKKCGKCDSSLCSNEKVENCENHFYEPHCNRHSMNEAATNGITCLPLISCDNCKLPFIKEIKFENSDVYYIQTQQNKSICYFCSEFDLDRSFEITIKNGKLKTIDVQLNNLKHIENYLLKNGDGKYFVISKDQSIVIRKTRRFLGYETAAFNITKSGQIKSQLFSKSLFGKNTLTEW